MISSCKTAGVGVIAGALTLDYIYSLVLRWSKPTDTVLNHMSGAESGTGVGGSSFTHYNYPGIYQNQASEDLILSFPTESWSYLPQDFHHCHEPGSDIGDYNDRMEVQSCELVNLAE